MAVLGARLVIRNVNKRLKELTRVADEISIGNLDVRIDNHVLRPVVRPGTDYRSLEPNDVPPNALRCSRRSNCNVFRAKTDPSALQLSQPTACFGLFHDITRRKEAEED